MDISHIAKRLRQASRVVVLTGAGVSAESGVPTFRDAQTGLWEQYRAEDLASPDAFRRNPRLVWDWYAWRRELVCQAQPNAGHYALAELERIIPEFTLITQNVDSLHHRAGSHNVIELHGNIARIICADERVIIESWDDSGEEPPRCPHCGGLLRPDVVWFGEPLPKSALARAMAASRECEVFLVVGTSSQVYPAAELPYYALESGAVVIEINPTTTSLSTRCTATIQGPSGTVLPELLNAVTSQHE